MYGVVGQIVFFNLIKSTRLRSTLTEIIIKFRVNKYVKL